MTRVQQSGSRRPERAVWLAAAPGGVQMWGKSVTDCPGGRPQVSFLLNVPPQKEDSTEAASRHFSFPGSARETGGPRVGSSCRWLAKGAGCRVTLHGAAGA